MAGTKEIKMWQMSTEETAAKLVSDPAEGLTSDEAAARLGKFGPNQLMEKKGESPFRLFLRQFENFIIWILIAAALISGFLKEWVDAVAIIAIVILNAIIGFSQEFRAEKALAALKKLSSPFSKTIRNGKHSLVPSTRLVPGDIVDLEAGDHVPADCRVFSSTSTFAVEEASLTGESVASMKDNAAIPAPEVPLGDRTNMVFMGTTVVSGKARCMVGTTGMQTELGRIAGMLQGKLHETTPLQRKLDEFGKLIVKICFVLVGMVFVLYWLRGGKIFDAFLTSVSLAVAAIPEGLPAIVTIALALGVQRMVRRNALIRKLPSVETLGCATVICSDKTGTLTRNEMTIQAVLAGGRLYRVTGIGYAPKGDILLDGKPVRPADHADLIKGLACGTLCNGSTLAEEDGTFKIVGDPTEGSILTCAAKAGIWKNRMEKENPYLDEITFDSGRKMMTVLRRRKDGGITAFVKGAPDLFLKKSAYVEKGGKAVPITDADRKEITSANERLTGEAMRVLAIGYREFDKAPDKINPETVEKDLTFTALVAMIDPPRDEARDAIGRCRTAGIRTVMITGDHKNTAVAIARDLGMGADEAGALSGSELDAISDDELTRRVENISVYARVSPEHKLRIVKALRKVGHVVAMTGDGVNDAPAVKDADIGVAMGITGTDVTKEVSDMVVTDDNFASIVSAVEEGRGIYDNIQKSIHYLLSCNAAEILVMFIASLVGMPVPLLPIQILWINLVTDGLPALALGVDPMDKNIMNQKPRSMTDPVISRRRLVLMMWQGFVIAFCALFAFCLAFYFEHRSWTFADLFRALSAVDTGRLAAMFSVPEESRELFLGRARTVIFIVLAMSQDFHSYNCRNQVESLFRIGFFTNKKLIGATLVSMTLNMMAIYCPFFQHVLKTQPLTAGELALVIAFASIPLWAMETYKAMHRPGPSTAA